MKCTKYMAMRGYSRVLIWIAIIGITLQFLNYQWKRLKFPRNLAPSGTLQPLSLQKQGPVNVSAEAKGHNRTGQMGTSTRRLGDIPYSLPTDLDFRIIVLTYNRAESVGRLLTSLNDALYFGDKVGIDVWIDRSKDGHIDEKTYSTARNFKFQHGVTTVHNQTVHAGIYGQWMKTWRPSPDSTEIAVILEDDITVSKFFYKWLVNVHWKYDSLSYVNGYVLQGKGIEHVREREHLRDPNNTIVFTYPVIGTWGFSPNRENWISYVKWYYNTSKMADFQPFVPGIISTSWYKAFIKRGTTSGMWTMWHIYHAWKFKLRTIYPNLPKKAGLAIHWRDPGLHYFSKPISKNPDPIVTEWDPRFTYLPAEPIHLTVHGKECPREQYY